MARIEKIKLRNFQSIASGEFILGDITIISGKSDVGKSAVIRSISAFLTNRFKEHFAHNGLLPCCVGVKTLNDSFIGGRFSKGIEYKHNKITYTKTDKRVPQEILNAIGIQQYEIDDDLTILLNLQRQFDEPFLLGPSSSTNVTKIIGRVSYLNKIVIANRSAIARKVELNKDIAYNKARSAQLKSFIKDLDILNAFEKKIELCDGYEAEIVAVNKGIEDILHLVAEFEDNNFRMANLERKISSIVIPSSAKIDSIWGKQELSNTISVVRAEIFIKEAIVLKSSFIDQSEIDVWDSTCLVLENFLLVQNKIDVGNRMLKRFPKKQFDSSLLEELLEINYSHRLLYSAIGGKEYFIAGVSGDIASNNDSMRKIISDCAEICPFSGGEFFDSCKELLCKN